MDNKQKVLSISYVEFINNIDNLVFELMYSPLDGYTNLSSYSAIKQAQSYIDKFNLEADKLKKQVNFENSQEIIENRLKNLIDIIKEHYNKELINWADETYKQAVENTLTLAFSHRKDINELSFIYNRAKNLINWISSIKQLNSEQIEFINSDFNSKFEKIINSCENDYFTDEIKTKTDIKFFIKLRNMLEENENEFLKLDLNSYKLKLSQDDLSYFNKIKKDMQTFKRTSVFDEISLLNSAMSVLNLNKDEEKYDFLKQIDNDFNLFLYQNKELKEQDKINLTKRRIELFRSKKENKKLQYYTNLITS